MQEKLDSDKIRPAEAAKYSSWFCKYFLPDNFSLSVSSRFFLSLFLRLSFLFLAFLDRACEKKKNETEEATSYRYRYTADATTLFTHLFPILTD